MHRLPPPPLPPANVGDARIAKMMQLWPAPPIRSPLFYDTHQSLVVRCYEDSRIAADQLDREGLLMTFKVGNERINAIWDRMIANKEAELRRRPPPRLPPRLPPPLLR